MKILRIIILCLLIVTGLISTFLFGIAQTYEDHFTPLLVMGISAAGVYYIGKTYE